MLKIFFVLILSILAVACSDPKSTKLPLEMEKWDSIKPKLEKLSEDEKGLFTGYAMRKAMKGSIFATQSGTTEATTIGEAIEAQRKFIAESKAKEATQKAEMVKILAESEAAEKAMREFVSVGLAGKKIQVERGVSGMELDRKLIIAFVFKNNSTKKIAGVKGRIVIKDLFGDEISGFQISNDETIEVGGRTTWEGERSVKYAIGSSNKDEKFAELADDKFTLEWKPQVIVFSDGTKVDAPAAR